MARKKQEDIDYEKLHNSSMEDVIAEPTEDELEQARLEGEEELEAAEEENTPVGEKSEKEEEGVEWDPEAFEKRMEEKFGKMSEDTAKKVVESVSGATEKKIETDEELQSPWDKEKRTPKDYNEITDWAIKKKEILDTRTQATQAAQTAEQQKATEEANKQQLDGYNKYIDDQIADLQQAGKINTEAERKALFQKMLDINLDRSKNGLGPIFSLKEIFYEHYEAPDEEVAGADAPVSPGGGTVEVEEKEVDYKDVHNKSLVDILLGR